MGDTFDQGKEDRAREVIEAYNQKYRRFVPGRERPDDIPVEETFDEFVRNFGGSKISDLLPNKSQMPLNADYLFREHNVIAELKTLEGVYAGEEGIKQFTQAFIDSGCTGSELMGTLWRGEPIPEPAAELIRKRTRRSLEQRLKNARKQLKVSKTSFGNHDTKLIILIASNQRPIFGHRAILFHLATIMGSNYADQHTDGVVYFNPNTPTKISSDSMEFSGWFPFYRDDEVNAELANFVNLLGNRWLTFYAERIGETNPILEVGSFEGMSAILK